MFILLILGSHPALAYLQLSKYRTNFDDSFCLLNLDVDIFGSSNPTLAPINLTCTYCFIQIFIKYGLDLNQGLVVAVYITNFLGV